MIEFFKGWRRKTGVLTLLLALVFMGGWMRSLTFFDMLSLPSGKDVTDHWISDNGHILWASSYPNERSASAKNIHFGIPAFFPTAANSLLTQMLNGDGGGADSGMGQTRHNNAHFGSSLTGSSFQR